MSFFRNFFRSKSQNEREEIKSTERGKYMPKQSIPIDESFTINFKSNGGKFLYCENQKEIDKALDNILKENDWREEYTYFYDKSLEARFKKTHLKINQQLNKEVTYFVTTCENLIADDGSLLISSNQIAEKKLNEFPDNFIVFATTSQIVTNIGEGLREIKAKNTSRIPTNITTIKHFKDLAEKDFLSYGSSTKNLYLLLLEDL